MFVSLIMDGLLAVLLVATILFAIKLNGRLAALRQDSDRLQSLIQGLQGASGVAEEAVTALRLTAGDAGHNLQATIDEAKSIEGDLRFITERAGEIANRLEAGLRQQRDQQTVAAGPRQGALSAAQQAAAMAAAADAKGNQSRLAMLLKQAEASDMPSAKSEPVLDRTPSPTRARPVDLAEPGPRLRPVREGVSDAAPPSRAERDLLRALEARSRT